jgi:phosphoribosylglycinamide formyltransferase-1
MIEAMASRASPSTIAKRRARLVTSALALPEVVAEGEQHVGFSVRKKRFAWLVQDHHGDGRVALHCKAEPGTNAGLAQAYPDRFHVPAYVGKQGWLGLWLDLPGIDWDEVAEVLRDAHRLAAPASLRAKLDKNR